MSYLAIEITRRCNQECQHCMRGDAIDSDLRPSVIDRIVDVINSAEFPDMDVLLTGGEPFLRPDIIRELLHRCPSAYFCVVTNGTIVTPEALVAAAEILERCAQFDEKRDHGPIAYSNDQFHIPAHPVWKRLGVPMRNVHYDAERIVPAGRALANGFGNLWEGVRDDSIITITTTGFVVLGCCYEYGKETVIGDIYECDVAAEMRQSSCAHRKSDSAKITWEVLHGDT